MKYDLTTGRAVGTAVPEHFGVGANWLDGIRKWAKAGASILPALALGFTTDTYLKGDEFAPNFVELSDFSRASKAWEANWDGKSGSQVGWLREYGVDERRVGIYGPTIEAASTNQIRNPRVEGAEAGTPGTFPTNWSAVLNGTTMNVQGSGTEGGWHYADIEVTGTAAGSFSINLEDAGVVAAVNGQDWTQSVGLRLMSGDFTNAGTPRLVLRQRTGALGSLAEFHEDVSIDGLHRRFFLPTVTDDPSVAYVQPTLKWAGAGGAVQFVLRIYTPQLEQAATPTSPILPTAGTPAAATRAADIVTGVTTDRASLGWYDTQWDYTNGGVAGDLLEFLPGVPRVGPKGLLVEEGTTNHIRNPRCEGATVGVVGSGGARPTNFGTVLSGLDNEVVATGVANGWDYVDLRFYGNLSAGTVISLYLEAAAQVAALTGQDWTQSISLALVSGDFANIVDVFLILEERTASGSVQSNVSSSIKDNISSELRRFYQTETLSGGASTAYLRPRIQFNSTASEAIDFTLRVSAPQLEQKAYPTSVVLPEAGSPAAATRADDTCSLATAPGWWGSREFTVYAAFETAMARMAPARTNVFTLDDGSFDNILNVWIDNSGANLRARQSTNAGPYLAGEVDTPWGVDGGETTRVAISIAENDLRYVASKPGGSYEQDVTSLDTAFVGNVTRLLLGADNAGRHLNGFIKELSIRPNRVTDAELEALVA